MNFFNIFISAHGKRQSTMLITSWETLPEEVQNIACDNMTLITVKVTEMGWKLIVQRVELSISGLVATVTSPGFVS